MRKGSAISAVVRAVLLAARLAAGLSIRWSYVVACSVGVGVITQPHACIAQCHMQQWVTWGIARLFAVLLQQLQLQCFLVWQEVLR
jgi:hypothetical protein